METSDAGRAFIQAWEALRLTVYSDGVGKATVGWGHLVRLRDALRIGDTISRERADALFAGDILLVDDALSGLPVDLAQYEHDALASWLFNCGTAVLQGSTLRKQLQLGLRTAAADQLLRWDKGHDASGALVTLPGLAKRRAAERKLFLTGVYDATH
jgi:lysozyme